MTFVQLITAIGIPVVRGICGWGVNALEDGKIDLPEIQRLIKTTVELSVIGFGAYFALDQFGFNVSLMAPMIGVAVADMAFSVIKKGIKQK